MEEPKLAILFLKFVEFWATFDIQVDITLTIFWEITKLRNYTF